MQEKKSSEANELLLLLECENVQIFVDQKKKAQGEKNYVGEKGAVVMVWKEIHGNKQNGDYKILIRFGAQDDDLKNSFEKKRAKSS